MLLRRRFLFLPFSFAAPARAAGSVYTYVGNLESRSVLIAWGTTAGTNTIGRSSTVMGKAVLTVGDQKIASNQNWATAGNLDPDKDYQYEVAVEGRKIGEGKFHTWPEQATSLCFFVLGDYGNGTEAQFQVSRAMEREFKRRASTNFPVRFVITTGDNIYADVNVGFRAVHSGDSDTDWEDKFFRPYQNLIREIPFLPSPGNHDGNGSETRADLSVYLDNFYYPQNKPARWYTFQYANLAQFFSLDSTTNTEAGSPHPVFLEDGEQFKWFRNEIEKSKTPWRIPYWHHPIFNAGPFHHSAYKELKHFLPVFKNAGVKTVFSGHEHNFQFSEQTDNTWGMRFIVSGAGGELRHGDVRSKMEKARIEGWAAELHFTVVEIEGTEMRITPVGVNAPVRPFPAWWRRSKGAAKRQARLIHCGPEPATTAA